MRRALFLCTIMLLMVSCTQQQYIPDMPPAKGNVILCIGDGMGAAHIRAASLYETGEEDGLGFQQFPVRTLVNTVNRWGGTTDSGAASTAMATGIPVGNSIISINSAGEDVETLLEYLGRFGKRTGLVTTTHMTHATPAAFGAHTENRGNYDEIASDYLIGSRPNVLLGGGGYGLSVSDAQAAGYTVITDETAMDLVDTDSVEFLSGQFGSGHLPYVLDGYWVYPTLRDMTETTIDILEEDPDGFFLMIEGGRIDHAAHANDLERMIAEMIAFSDAIDYVIEWSQGRDDTLIIVTADHETGRLSTTIPVSSGTLPKNPDSYWGHSGHTSRLVPLYAWGYGADGFISEQISNEAVHDLLLEYFR